MMTNNDNRLLSLTDLINEMNHAHPGHSWFLPSDEVQFMIDSDNPIADLPPGHCFIARFEALGCVASEYKHIGSVADETRISIWA